jgi:hypothetical protein
MLASGRVEITIASSAIKARYEGSLRERRCSGIASLAGRLR